MSEAKGPIGAGRLRPMAPAPMGPLASLIAAYHIGDPLDASDSWRPLLRRRRLQREAESAAIGHPASAPGLDPEVDQ